MCYELLREDKYMKFFSSNCSQNDSTLLEFVNDVNIVYSKIANDTINLTIFERINEMKKMIFIENGKDMETKDFIFSIPDCYFEAFDNFSLFCLLYYLCSPGYYESGDCLKAANEKIIYKIINNIK